MASMSRALDMLLRMSIGASILGLALTAVTLTLSFETPNSILLGMSAICVLSVPAAVLVHLAATPDLSRLQKRVWLKAFAGRKAPSAFADYLRSSDRGATADAIRDLALLKRTS